MASLPVRTTGSLSTPTDHRSHPAHKIPPPNLSARYSHSPFPTDAVVAGAARAGADVDGAPGADVHPVDVTLAAAAAALPPELEVDVAHRATRDPRVSAGS